MTDLRTAAQQALEALKDYKRSDDDRVSIAMHILCTALAEPTVKESLQVESAFAENATTQQQLEEAPPSDYRRGYWDGFEIGKREGRIEAENALAEEQADPDNPERRCGGPGCDMKCCQPVQEPVKLWPLAPLTGYYDVGGKRVWLEKDEPFPQPAPPQRKPLTEAEIDHAANNILTDDPVQWWRKLARAIERAHGIGGEG